MPPTRMFTDEQAQDICALYDSGMSQQQIADHFGCSQTTIYQTMRRAGVSVRAGKSNHRRGPEHPSWRGGRTVNHDGYIKVKNGDVALADMEDYQGYILEHRLVMAKHIGRPLFPYETVHHIDGDRQNNELENLQLRIGRHGKGAAFECQDCGSYNVVAIELSDITEN